MDDGEVVVDLVRSDGSTHLYLEGGDAMTAEQARALAIALVDAGIELEKGNAGQ